MAVATRLDLPPTFTPAAELVLRMKELDKRAKEVCPRSTKRVMFFEMWRGSALCISGVCEGGGRVWEVYAENAAQSYDFSRNLEKESLHGGNETGGHGFADGLSLSGDLQRGRD